MLLLMVAVGYTPKRVPSLRVQSPGLLLLLQCLLLRLGTDYQAAGVRVLAVSAHSDRSAHSVHSVRQRMGVGFHPCGGFACLVCCSLASTGALVGGLLL
jgi:hypothetical protein